MANIPPTGVLPGHLGQTSGLDAPVEQKPALAEQFQLLAAAWRKGTAHMSSSSDKVAHPAFQAIVNLGSPAIPLLLRELANGTGQWHRALQRITGVNPVSTLDQGNLEKITAAWLRWGHEQGHQW